ncbi:MAG: hypothetical protein LQ351_000130 [Letrouitia transgressa]|nr:MAG: hypothetical protein LQ351_000130 [Letrouitia transgressa]
MGILEHLTQLSQPTLSQQHLLEIWLGWYRSSGGVDLKKIEALILGFENSSACKRGILDLRHISSGQYFSWVYLPSILAIVAAIIWGFIDDKIKRIEPFHQASRPGGARAGNTISADYIRTVTPILQSQLFQVQVQVVQVGYGIMGNQSYFRPFYPDGSGANLSFYDEQYDGPVYGRCRVAGKDDIGAEDVTLGDMLGAEDSEGLFRGGGAVRSVLYLDSSLSRAQEALLLLVLVLGALLTYRLIVRHSGMMTSYGNLASLSAIATADPSFLRILSNTVDLSQRRVKLWKDCLNQAIVYLGDIPCDLDIVSGSRSTLSSSHGHGGNIYGLHFGPFSKPDCPSSTRDRHPSNNRIMYYVIRICQFLFLVCLILSFVSGINDKKAGIFENAAETQNPTPPITVLIVSAITKTLWKTIEQRAVTLAPFYRRFSTSSESELSASPNLGREYSRMPPGYLTICAFRDQQHTLAIVSLTSIFIEVANFLLAVATSMSQGSGWNAANLLKLSISAAVFFGILFTLCFLSCHRLFRSFPPVLGTPDTIAKQLAYVSRSDFFLNDMQPLKVIPDQKDRMAYLKDLGSSYCFGRVRASDLTGGFTYGIERSQALLPAPGGTSSHPEFPRPFSVRRLRKETRVRDREESSRRAQQTWELS